MNTTNLPPLDVDPLRERLEEAYGADADRRDDLVDAVDRVPNPITSEGDAKRAADFVKMITAHHKKVEVARVAEKEPFLKSSRTVDGFFKAITDPLKEAQQQVERIITAYQREKAAAERRARLEEERRLAEEAERKRLEAEHAASEAQTEGQLEAAIEEADEAAAAEAVALAAQKAADAKAAELSRTRGDEGAVASLRTFWDFKDLDRASLDLEALRQHIPQEALEKAVRSYIKAGGRKLAGVTIFENAKTVVR